MNYLSILKFKNQLIPRDFSINTLKRTFLTENYYCYDQWDKFLTSNASKHKEFGPVNILSMKLNEKLKNKQLVTPLDMDMLASKMVHVNNFQELEFIESIFTKFRKTQAAILARDSMHHSFVRSYIDLNQMDRLVQILKLKYEYGIFVDSYTANLLMDQYLKKNDFEKAALVAHEILLQENSENSLTLMACLLSCVKYLQNPPEPTEEPKEDEDVKKTKRLVYFLRKPYNDEHFDLNNVGQLSGKTIYFAADKLDFDKVLKNSLKVYGLLAFNKFDKALKLFESEFPNTSAKPAKFVVDEFLKVNALLEKNEEQSKKYETFLQKSKELCKNFEKNTVDVDLLKELQSKLEQLKSNQVDSDIKRQAGLYTQWANEQESELKKQIKNFEIESKKNEMFALLNEIERKEEIFSYFKRKNVIESHYFNKGFMDENPSDIPIQAPFKPNESIFKSKFERHFKPWPKYMNRPKESVELTKINKENQESLSKIYLHKITSTTDSPKEN